MWEGYTVHDAANVLRRYLNDLPEPVVPLDLYEKFRDPLRGATKQAVGDAEGPQFVENFDEKSAITKYQQLITELPPLNRQLLLYLLDLLAVFAAKSDENRMTSQNLAAIFQPGMLSHPNHAMAPEEYRLNQCVIIFLIENQDHFLIGMQGTAADEKTKKEIETGAAVTPETPISKRRSGGAAVGVYRSSSNGSAAAHSVRRDGQLRRNRSVNSRHSKHDGSTTPNSPALSATQAGGGLGRSNTVPSKKSPAVPGGKFKKHDYSPGPHSPAQLEPLTQAQPAGTPRISEQSSLAPPVVHGSSGADRSQERLLSVPQEQSTPQKERNLPSLFQRSPGDETRKPNKLKKKRIPGSMNHSAHSSNTSLPPHSTTISPNAEPTNPIDPTPLEEPQKQQATTQPPPGQDQTSEAPNEPRRPSQVPPGSSLRPESTLKGKKSPAGSLHSSYNEGSDLELATSEHQDKDKRSKWLSSLNSKKDDKSNQSEQGPQLNEIAEASQTSLTNSGSQNPRKSFTGDTVDSSNAALAPAETHQSSQESNKDGKDEKSGPLGWIKTKYREAKENAEQRRNKSPPAAEHGHGRLAGGKSLDIRRDSSAEKKEPPTEKREDIAPAPVPDEKTEQPAPPTTTSAELQSQPQPQQPEEQHEHGTEKLPAEVPSAAAAASSNDAEPPLAEVPKQST